MSGWKQRGEWLYTKFGSVSFRFFRDDAFEDCIAFFVDCIILRNDVNGKGMGWS